ncbi:thiamine phosphate pyrophosphorylase [Tamlana nanhaiensis]|uniref:Thiamine phosphate pyrophosphorylase n=1 Tax=Neotamlana nanhaiensis TaxID=1382798 RepID=A0A0D7W1I2_9FLAO|nr:thiamine phosphate synthase [Tamlana nanhaiensis]KJD31712.1 thiamine phosphate pyrophosphorylase [Tamlana nanhaiensis]
MLIVITSETNLPNEATLINQLFKTGLQVLHLRKPSFQINDYREFIKQIQVKYHSKIMIHQYHELSEEFGLKGVHLQEQTRIDLSEDLFQFVEYYKQKGYTVSSSFHDPEVLNNCKVPFHYHLLSPVFSSISKQGYQGKGFNVNAINKTIIGMGGVTAQTIPKMLALGYRGVGVLGGVWNTKDPIQSFKIIQDTFLGVNIKY